MDECGAEEVEAKTSAANDHDKLGIVHSCVSSGMFHYKSR